MIEETAIVDADARVDKAVHIGPHAVIGPGVEIGAGTEVGPHTVIRGPTRIGKDNRIYPFCSIGESPQDKKYRDGEQSILEIGNGNVIREYCSIHRGTAGGGGLTRIGDGNWIMAYTHIAHDCLLGDDIVISNGAQLAGHVRVDDHAALGGMAGVHQFCSIGSYCFVSAGTLLVKDVPPCMVVGGMRDNRLYGVNKTGLRRYGMNSGVITVLHRAFRLISDRSLRIEDLLCELDGLADECSQVAVVATFIRRVAPCGSVSWPASLPGICWPQGC